MSNRKSPKGFTLVEIIIIVVIVGLLAAMAIPAFKKVQENARKRDITENLETIASAGQKYILENGVTEVNYQTLIEHPGLLPPIQAIAGEDYTALVIQGSSTPEKQHTLTVVEADKTPVSIQY